MMDESDQTNRTAIKAYPMEVREEKHHYFPTLIMSTECCLEALFRITWSLLGQESLGDHLQGCADEFAEHLVDKWTNTDSFPVGTHAWCRSMCDAWGKILPGFLESVQSCWTDEVDRVFEIVSTTTCQLYPCLQNGDSQVGSGSNKLFFLELFKEALVHILL